MAKKQGYSIRKPRGEAATCGYHPTADMLSNHPFAKTYPPVDPNSKPTVATPDRFIFQNYSMFRNQYKSLGFKVLKMKETDSVPPSRKVDLHGWLNWTPT